LLINEKIDKKNKKTRDAKIDLRSGVPKLVTQNRQKNDSPMKPDAKRMMSKKLIEINDVKSNINGSIF
jgi:hypothetical protein